MAKKLKKRDDISCEITEIYGYLNKKKSKVLVKVSWNGGPERVEIRRCWTDHDDIFHLGSGIALDDEAEIDELIALLKKRPRPVDFNEIFKTSEGIMDKRRAGYRTEDGFIVLTPTRSDLFDQFRK